MHTWASRHLATRRRLADPAHLRAVTVVVPLLFLVKSSPCSPIGSVNPAGQGPEKRLGTRNEQRGFLLRLLWSRRSLISSPS